MTIIYVAHSKAFDYKNELYLPLKQSRLNDKYEILLLHEHNDRPFSSKNFFRKECGLVVAEVSFPATGLGIELGWVDAHGVPIICVYKKGARVSNSVRGMSDMFVEYANTEKLVSGIEKIIESDGLLLIYS